VKPPAWLNRSADGPVICEAQAAYLDELATQAARWEKFDKRARKGEEWVEVTPPSRFVQTLLARPGWPFPLLEGIIHSPTLRPDGSLLGTPGYDVSTGLYLDFGGTTFPRLLPTPTFDDARSALGRLSEVFKDFPFAVREAHTETNTNPYFSAALAATLTLVGRPAIQGNVPLFGVTATAAGSGKGLLVDAISRIGTGRYAPKMGQTLDDNEELKRLLALALEGASVCCIDNVTHPLGNQYLDMAVTAQAITGRILGQTQTAEASWNAVLFATGNNLSYRGDMTRRVVPIALDPQMEKPEERSGFTHPDLEAWIMEERPRLVICALTILRAYCVAGRPAQSLTPYGSFQPWSDLIRSAIVWLGEADPCEGRQDLAAQTDETYEHLATLLGAWEACYALDEAGVSKAMTLNQVKQDIALYATEKDGVPNMWDELQHALVPFDRRYDGKSLNSLRIGNALRKVEGRVIGNKRLRRHGEYRHNLLWRIERV
jgi:putative DNA primase/helicase